MQKKVRVDFYHVRMPENAQTLFEDALANAWARRPGQAARNMPRGDAYLRLEELDRHMGLFIGLMLRIRMQDFPQVVNLDGGSPQELPLGDSQGLGEPTAFLYSPSHKVLMVQNNWEGVRASSLVGYVEWFAEFRGLVLEPVLEEDALNRLKKMGVFSRFEVALSGLDPKLVAPSGASVERMLNVINDANAANFHLVLSAKRGKKNPKLTPDWVRGSIGTFLGATSGTQDNVTQLIVTGAEDAESAAESLDILHNRMRTMVNVNVSGRTLSAGACKEAILAAYGDKREELGRIFRGAS